MGQQVSDTRFGATVYFDFEKEMQQVAIFLNAEADLLADRLELKIKGMMAKGMVPDAILGVLRTDLREGGQLFGGFASTLRRNVFPVIDNVAQGALMQANPDEGGWKWITTSYEPCRDCLPRHGQVKTYSEWESLGLPRSGFSVCGENCKCVLAPKGSVARSAADGPVKVPTLAQARASFDERLKSDASLKKRLEEYRASLTAKK